MSRIAPIAGIVLGLLIASVSAAAPNCGDPLFAPDYKGVTAKSNGTSMRSGESCAGRGTYGLQYQCVEFIRRFYAVALNVDTTGWTGLNARDFFAAGPGLGLTRFENGKGQTPPIADDIIVFQGPADDKYGHIAIANEVTQTSISIVEQNWGDSGKGQLSLTKQPDGTYMAVRDGSKYTVMGWLRKESSSPLGRWRQGTPFPGAVPRRQMSVSFAIGDKGYVAVACYIGALCNGEFWEFNATAGSWRQLGNSPSIQFQSPVFVLNGKAYVVSGNQVWQYAPSTNLWTRKGDIPGASKRAGFGFAVGGKGYIGGGFFNGGALWQYNSTSDSWIQRADHPVLQYGLNDTTVSSVEAVTFVLGSKAYVTGTNSYFWEYSPSRDEWVEKAYVDAVYGQAFAIGTYGYVFNAKGELYRYNTASNSWAKLAAFPGAGICYPEGIATRDNLYVGIGGDMSNNSCGLEVVNAWWKFSP